MLYLLGLVLMAPPTTAQVTAPSFIQASASWMNPGVICRMLPRQRTGMQVTRADNRIELVQAGFSILKGRCQTQVTATEAIGPLAPGSYQVVWKGPEGFGFSVAPIVATAKDGMIDLKTQATVVVHAMGVGKGVCDREKLRLRRDGEAARMVIEIPSCGGDVQRSFALSPGKWSLVAKGGALVNVWALGESKDAARKP